MKWNRTSQRGTLVVSLLLALAVMALGACTMGGGESAGDIPEVTLEMADGTLSVPADVPSGVVAFDMAAAPDAIPARLNDNVTLDQLNEALMQPDPFAALGLVSLLGGASNTTDGRLIVDLKPGQHVVVNFPDDGPPSVSPFNAGEPSGATAPTPDITVDLVDFNFALPAEIETGPKVWQINNKGGQWHEMAILQMEEGMSVDDLLASLESEESSDGPPPIDAIAFWSPNGPGETGWVTWDLPPGEYTVICFLPDIAGDMSSHAAHGMVSQLTVTE